jgi:hypothetical protein
MRPGGHVTAATAAFGRAPARLAPLGSVSDPGLGRAGRTAGTHRSLRRRPLLALAGRAERPALGWAEPAVVWVGQSGQMAWVRSKLRSRAMRSSVGGCVEKRLAKFTWRPVRGLMMYAVASAGFTSIGVRLAAASIF